MRALVVGNNWAFENKVLACLEAHPDIEILGVVGDGKEGIRLAKQFSPDLVITQFDMPDMTALALTRALKSDGIPPPAVVIVALSDDPSYGRLAYQAGADGYLARTTFGQLEPLVERLKEQA
jgi:two-component system, NarL family, response regulator DesR